MVGQRPARRLRSVDRHFDRHGNDLRGGRQPLCLVSFQRLDRQLELIDLTLQLLRGLAELDPSVARQLEAQLGDLGLSVNRVLCQPGDNALPRSCRREADRAGSAPVY